MFWCAPDYIAPFASMESNQHPCALKTIRISTMCFQTISNIHWYKRLTLYVFWRPKPNLPTMVEITTRVQISFQGEKPITIPQELVFEDDGHKWLKLRPTSQPIIQLIHGGAIGKNASLSSSNALKSLLDARNTAFLQGPPGLEANNGENLFEDSAKQPQKKRKLMDENRIVYLEVGDHKVQCLMFGNRPTRSDLAILLDPNHLEPLILHFRNAGPANLQAKKWSKSHADTD